MRACVAAGIAKGEVVHLDATLIRANVAWESLGVRHAEAVLVQDGVAPAADAAVAAAATRQAECHGKQTGRYKKVRLADLDATMATNAQPAARAGL